MEQLLLGIFQEELSKYLVGFRKEQVNANLLNGKGEIRDVRVNCSFINDLISKITPFIALESIQISKLGFNVTSWPNIRKAPIVVDIEDVNVTIVEPLTYLDKSQRRTLRQLSQAEFNEYMKDKKPRGPYNLLDRILDNLQVEIKSVNISFQPRGRFKTQRVGPWTPPRLLLTLKNVKYCSVNEFGNEANPDECWRHNTFAGHPSEKSVTIYKKATMQVSMAFQIAEDEDRSLPPIMNDAAVQVHFAFHKKVNNGAILAIQLDATMNRVEIHIDEVMVPILAHAIMGMKFCFTKDRAFEDPLRSEESAASDSKTEARRPIVLTESSIQADDDMDASDDDTGEDEENPDSLLVDENEIAGALEAMDAGADPDAGLGEGEQKIPDAKGDGPASDTGQSKSDKTGPSDVNPGASGNRYSKPVLVLPSGIVIHRQVSISLSIQDCKVRGTYGGQANGYVQLETKGLVAEMIWPKVTREKGIYVQMSLAFLTLQEWHGKKLRTLLRGGSHHHKDHSPIELSEAVKPLIPRDENFPLFEDRCIRPDPLDLRHSFPAQAFGFKTSVSYGPKNSNPEQDEILVLNEIGIDLFDVILESECWCRAILFAVNEVGGGFDPRWATGDWSDCLSAEMLVHSSKPLDLAEHVQAGKELFLDENHLISSDLFNMTARLSNMIIKIPAAVQRDIRSCDIVLQFSEMMMVVSSALPRTFLTGKIGSSIYGENINEGVPIDFPNDPSDICYILQAIEDPLLRQQGSKTSRTVSTFRSQITTRDLSIKLLPVVPYCDAVEPRNLLSPLEMTMLVCFEVEPPESHDSDLIKILTFVSLQLYRLDVNLDFDVVSGGIGCGLFHAENMHDTLSVISRLDGFIVAPEVTVNNMVRRTPDRRVVDSIHGRRVLVRRQIERSRHTGGFSFECGLQVAHFGLHLWRQQVPLNSRFRGSITGDWTRILESQISLVKLLSVELGRVELGVEGSTNKAERRFILKLCMSHIEAEVCDFDATCKAHLQGGNMERRSDENEDTCDTKPQSFVKGVTLVSLGGDSEKDICVRIEERSDTQKSVSLSADLDVGGQLNLHIHEIETLILLVAEAMLLPTEVKWSKSELGKAYQDSAVNFPDGTIGYLIVGLLSTGERKQVQSKPRFNFKKLAADSDSIDQLMNALISSMLPDETDRFLLRVALSDILIYVPNHARTVSTEEESWLGQEIRKANILSGYLGAPARAAFDNASLEVLGTKGRTWSSFFGEQDSGFYHNIETSQSLHSAVLTNSRVLSKRPLIDSFDVGLIYTPHSVNLSMGDSTLSVHDLAHMRNLHASVTGFIHRIKLMKHRVNSLVSSLAVRRHVVQRLNKDEADDVADVRRLGNRNSNEVVQDADVSLLRGRRCLEQLVKLIEKQDIVMRTRMKNKQDAIDRLRIQVFLKEKDRLSALALLSCQAAGWLRVGGTHMTGERSPTTSNMWRFHAVLRKSLLILYASPGQPRPLDIVNLNRASLYMLAGGRRKRDLKYGFGIVERDGCTRFVLAPNGSEFEVWLRQLTRAIRAFSVTNDLKLPADTTIVNSVEILDMDNESGQALDQENLETFQSFPGRVPKVRDRFTRARASLESAVQAARQRVASSELTPSDLPSDLQEPGHDETITSIDSSTPSVSPAVSTADLGFHAPTKTALSDDIASDGGRVSADISPNEAPSLTAGQRFANIRSSAKSRIGSAMQGAKEKAQAVAEERRRRKEEREQSEKHGDGDDSGMRKIHGLRGRLENVAASVRSKKEGEVDEEPAYRSNIVSTPDLERVTNTLQVSISQESLSGYEQSVDVPEDEEEVPLETGEEPCDGRPTKGRQIRDKFSKLGAAVKSGVRQGSQIARSASAISGEDESSMNLRFSIRRNRQDGAPLPEESDLFKLKKARISSAYTPTDNEISDGGTLAKIKGSWTVKVKSQKCSGDNAIPIAERNEKSDHGAGNCTIIMRADGDDGRDQDGVAKESYDIDGQASNFPAYSGIEEGDAYDEKLFCLVRVFSQDLDQGEIKVSSINRGFQDVIGLFIDVMESLASAQLNTHDGLIEEARNAALEMNEALSWRLGLAPIDIVQLTGELLGGLLSASRSFQSVSAYHEYQCEVFSEFLNACLTCPMPLNGCIAVLEFLDLTDAGTISIRNGTEIEGMRPSGSSKDSVDVSLDYVGEIMSLSSACLSHLVRAETSGIMAQKLDQEKESRTPTRDPNPLITTNPQPAAVSPFFDPLLPSNVTAELKLAMHNALTQVMEERDEAQAELIAASIFHVHEMESERRQVELVKKKLTMAQEELRRHQHQGLPLFADRSKSANVGTDLRKYLEQMVENSDKEIKGLCEQLTKEVNDKTKANLEILRLKESQKIERERDAGEIRALTDELIKAREELVSTQDKLRLAMEEIQNMKEIVDFAAGPEAQNK